MHKIEVKIDDSIYDKLMGLLEMLPSDKIEVTSSKEYAGGLNVKKAHVFSHEEKINALLKMERLSHFKFFENPSRILYTYENGTPTHITDFSRLKKVLKLHDIKFTSIGIDVVMLEED